MKLAVLGQDIRRNEVIGWDPKAANLATGRNPALN